MQKGGRVTAELEPYTRQIDREGRQPMDQISDFRSMRIGDVLKELGYATDEQIGAALNYQKEHKGIRLGQAFIQMGLISEKQMLTALGISTGFPVEELSQLTVDLDAAARIPVEVAERYQMLPIQAESGILTILTNDPLNFYGQEDIRQITGMDLELRLCESGPLSQAIRYYYSEIAARKAASAANDSSCSPDLFDFQEPSSVSWRRQSEALRRGIGIGIGKAGEKAESAVPEREGRGNDRFGSRFNSQGKERFNGGSDSRNSSQPNGSVNGEITSQLNSGAGRRGRDWFSGEDNSQFNGAFKDQVDSRLNGVLEDRFHSGLDGGDNSRPGSGIYGRFKAWTGGRAEDTPIIKLLNQLIQRAYRNNASDIHIEPHENNTVVRMRMDGAMREFVTLQKRVHMPLVARIKILGDMDIAERRLPQDGHFQMQIDGETVNTRVSVIPTVYGEKAVIRLLSGNQPIQYADTFGMNHEDYQKLRQMLDAPNGLIYLTGPTGSGKTTTLYLVLQELAKRPVNICTIEDPVEKNLPGISQCQVNLKKGLTFENGLRALLRQDPDIIMIGETRDKETAAISVRAAVTGHLVLSTLHTNDAASSIIRLKDMGVEPYLTASSLVGIVAQRLLRKLCPECARTAKADEEDWKLLDKRPARIRVPAGCPSCNGTGYRGRVAVHEILIVDQAVRRMISEGASAEQIREHGIHAQGMRTLKECAAELVEQGITSMEELKRAAYYNEMG